MRAGRRNRCPMGILFTGPMGTGKTFVAEAFAKDPETATDVNLLDVKRTALFESGGGGLVATTMDYARFGAMLLSNGRFEGRTYLGRKTLDLMTSDHLGSIPGNPEMLPIGYGFGLGFAVRLSTGVATNDGSTGDYEWNGVGGTHFWVDPATGTVHSLPAQARFAAGTPNIVPN